MDYPHGTCAALRGSSDLEACEGMITDRISARDVTVSDILEIISTRQSELNELEFKREADADLVKAACAIANFGGGYIIVGIDEDAHHRASSIAPVQNAENTADSIRQRLRDGISPRPVLEVVVLPVNGESIVVVRISTQSAPHMVSADKRSDFYGRYDATTERMRYEEIEQRFRDKFHSGGLNSLIPDALSAPHAIIETIQGRKAISTGSADALSSYVRDMESSAQRIFGLAAVADSITHSLNDELAKRLFQNPSYQRKAGWLAIHPELPSFYTGAGWQQDYGASAQTFVNGSADFTFTKAVDSVLCWNQSGNDLTVSPRIYPNALIEFILSYCYALSDLNSIARPTSYIIKAVLGAATNIQLPLGEGGSVWFDAPLHPPKRLKNSSYTSVPIAVDTNELRPRRVAFEVASQTYAFFGYQPTDVPFSEKGGITFQSDSWESKVTAARAALQQRLHLFLEGPSEDFDRRIERFAYDDAVRRKLIGFSHEFLDDYAGDEARLYTILASISADELLSDDRKMYPVITTEGVKSIPRR